MLSTLVNAQAKIFWRPRNATMNPALVIIRVLVYNISFFCVLSTLFMSCSMVIFIWQSIVSGSTKNVTSVRQPVALQQRLATQGSQKELGLEVKIALSLPTTVCHRKSSVMIFLNVNYQVFILYSFSVQLNAMAIHTSYNNSYKYFLVILAILALIVLVIIVLCPFSLCS